MVGHKLGEFSPTRQFFGHTPADKKAAQEKAATATVVRSAGPAASSGATPKNIKVKEGSSDAKK